MACDDEELVAAPWKREYGRRVFKYDAFLRYRRNDATAVRTLTDVMRGVGATVWLDEDDDLTDRRLLEKIGHAVFHSRYIVVCASSSNETSKWMPESVQCRLRTGRDLDFTTLSRKERLQLASRRIDILLKEPASNINYSRFREEMGENQPQAMIRGTFSTDQPVKFHRPGEPW
jgi:TIR domain